MHLDDIVVVYFISTSRDVGGFNTYLQHCRSVHRGRDDQEFALVCQQIGMRTRGTKTCERNAVARNGSQIREMRSTLKSLGDPLTLN